MNNLAEHLGNLCDRYRFIAAAQPVWCTGSHRWPEPIQLPPGSTLMDVYCHARWGGGPAYVALYPVKSVEHTCVTVRDSLGILDGWTLRMWADQ